MKQQTTQDQKKEDVTENKDEGVAMAGTSHQEPVEEWKNKYIRALADYQNLERRMREAQKEDYIQATERVMRRLLPIIDLLERAQLHLHDAGLSLVLKEAQNFFTEHHVERISTVGHPFDPYYMECITLMDGNEGIVAEEVAPGYTIGERLLRAAKVNVGKKKESTHDKPVHDEVM